MHTIGVKGGRERRGGGESREKGTLGLGWTFKQTSRRGDKSIFFIIVYLYT